MDDYEKSPVFAEIMDLIQKERTRLSDQRPSRTDALLEENRGLKQQIQGWMLSLGRLDLPEAVRRDLERQSAQAHDRIIEIDQELIAEEVYNQQTQMVIEPKDVAMTLRQLETIVATDNATAVNFELSLHIDEVLCTKDGQVNVRICKLGVVPDVVQLIQDANSGAQATKPAENGQSDKKIQPRRRTRLALKGDDDVGRGRLEQSDLLEFAMDPERFFGLPPEFFWLDSYQVPTIQCWAERNADAVHQRQQETGMSQEKLAKEFDVSAPTIRKALKIAKQRQS